MSYVLCMLNFEKAYNHVRWSTLDFIMTQIFEENGENRSNFGFLFVRYLVLVNDNPCKFFCEF